MSTTSTSKGRIHITLGVTKQLAIATFDGIFRTLLIVAAFTLAVSITIPIFGAVPAHSGVAIIASGNYTTTLLLSNPTATDISLDVSNCHGPSIPVVVPPYSDAVIRRVERQQCTDSTTPLLRTVSLSTDLIVSSRLVFNDGHTSASFSVPLLEHKLSSYDPLDIAIAAPVLNSGGDVAYVAIYNASAWSATVRVTAMVGTTLSTFPETYTAPPGWSLYRVIGDLPVGKLKIQQTTPVGIFPYNAACDLYGFVVWGLPAGTQVVIPF